MSTADESVPDHAQTRLHAALAQLARTARSAPVPRAPWALAVRRGLITGAPVALGAITGYLSAGLNAGMGAMNIGIADGFVARRALLRSLGLITIATSAMSVIAAIFGGSWWFVLILAVISFGCGALSGAGAVAFNAGLISLLVAIIFSGNPVPPAAALTAGAFVLAGGLLQTAAAVAAWRREQDRALRRAAAIAVDSIRRYVLAADSDGPALIDSAAMVAAAESALDATRLSGDRYRAYLAVTEAIDWTRLHVIEWLASGTTAPKRRRDVAEYLERAGDRLEHPARPEPGSWPDPGAPGNGDAWQGLTWQLNELAAAVRSLDATATTRAGPATPGPHGAPAAPAERATAPYPARPGPVSTPRLRARMTRFAGPFTPRNPLFTHGLRLALAVTIGEVIQRLLHLQHGYWVPLTIAVVTRPDFTGTLTRSLLRGAGTVAAVLFTGAIMITTGAPAWLLVVLVCVFATLTMRWFTGNYALAAFAITVTVLALTEVTAPSIAVVADRLVATCIGIVIAVAVHLAWPSWREGSAAAALLASVRAEQAWTNAVLDAITGAVPNDPGAIRRLGLASRGAALAAQPVAEGALVEARSAGRDPQAALAVQAALARTAVATLTLESALRSRTATSTAHDPAFIRAALTARERVDADFTWMLTALAPGAAEPAPAADSGAKRQSLVTLRSEITTGDQTADLVLLRLVSNADAAASMAPRV